MKLGDVPTSTSILAASQLAAQLRDQADLIRGRATHLNAAGLTLRWHSSASSQFHDHLAGSIATLLRSAASFETAADEITMLALMS